jgi:hypothetical protein
MGCLAGAALWVLGLSLVDASPVPVHKRYADMTDEEISAQIRDARKVKDLGERIQLVTDPFLGTPYVLGNMGEGPDGDGRDKDPRFNVTSTDCTTFVEHAMAFALSTDVAAARKRLDQIRYTKGAVNYGTRRHWPEAQWVPGLIEEGYLKDATADVAGPKGHVQTASVTLNAQAFKDSAHAASMQLTPAEIPDGTFSIRYLPIDEAAASEARMEAGQVINIVKAEKAGLLVRISHQGLVVRKGGKVFIRNATSVGPKAVVDEPLTAFISRQKTAKWATVGFQFLRATVPPNG